MPTFSALVVLFTFAMLGTTPALAEQCDNISGLDIRLYSEKSVPCSKGDHEDAKKEPQWLYLNEVWARYREFIAGNFVSCLESYSGECTQSQMHDSLKFSRIMFITRTTEESDGSAARTISHLYDFAKGWVGEEYPQSGGSIMAWFPVIIFDNGQVLALYEVKWKEKCNQMDPLFHFNWDNGSVSQYTMAIEGLEDVCTITVHVLL